MLEALHDKWVEDKDFDAAAVDKAQLPYFTVYEGGGVVGHTTYYLGTPRVRYMVERATLKDAK